MEYVYRKDASKPQGNINILYFSVFYHAASCKGDAFYTRGNSDEVDNKHNFLNEQIGKQPMYVLKHSHSRKLSQEFL